MDQNHPIPQQISSYQFRLVGDMTLKQFFQIASGALISLLIYSTSLHSLIKWPLILFFSLFGVALAFLPFEDRPLDRWIIAFFKSVYSPTMFSWKKSEKPPVFYREEATPPEDNIIAPHGEAALNTYLQTPAGRGKRFTDKFEIAENAFLATISSLFGGKQAPQPTAPVQQLDSSPPVVQTQGPPVKLKVEESKLRIPKTEFISVEKQTVKQPSATPSQPAPSTTPVGQVLSQPVPSSQQPPAQGAVFSEEAAPPTPPARPNTITGQVLDSQGKIIDGAILEIKDISGRPVRAVKTNKVGHFIVVTPLANGMYEIVTEKDGLVFANISFEATGEIIPPIAIRARNALKNNDAQAVASAPLS